MISGTVSLLDAAYPLVSINRYINYRAQGLYLSLQERASLASVRVLLENIILGDRCHLTSGDPGTADEVRGARAMLAAVLNILIGLAIAGAMLGGLALFWIARQDGSRLGSTLGVLFPILAIFATIYLTMGHHWL
jgi:hypothetical protein